MVDSLVTDAEDEAARLEQELQGAQGQEERILLALQVRLNADCDKIHAASQGCPGLQLLLNVDREKR